MRKIFKFLTFISSLLIVTSNSLLLIGCWWDSPKTPVIKDRDYYLSMLRYNIFSSKYHDFIINYEKKIKTPASAESNKEFDDLYDNITPPFWTSFDDLQDALLNTKLGKNNCDVNWREIYNNVDLTNDQKLEIEQSQLRFYNIISNVYGKKNILHLVQKIEAVESSKRNVIASTTYNGMYNNQRMSFGKKFADSETISHQFNTGFWAADDIDVVTIHEFGHGVSFFMNLSDDKRTKINTNWNWSTTSIANLNPSHSLTTSFLGKPIDNCAIKLMIYLDKKAHIPSNDSKNWLLFPLIVVRSKYGRDYWTDKKHGGGDDDFFAEAFVQWLLTPKALRGWNWELLNGFFCDYLPTFLTKI